jgi:hypothetical protein
VVAPRCPPQGSLGEERHTLLAHTLGLLQAQADALGGVGGGPGVGQHHPRKTLGLEVPEPKNEVSPHGKPHKHCLLPATRVHLDQHVRGCFFQALKTQDIGQ